MKILCAATVALAAAITSTPTTPPPVRHASTPVYHCCAHLDPNVVGKPAPPEIPEARSPGWLGPQSYLPPGWIDTDGRLTPEAEKYLGLPHLSDIVCVRYPWRVELVNWPTPPCPEMEYRTI